MPLNLSRRRPNPSSYSRTGTARAQLEAPARSGLASSPMGSIIGWFVAVDESSGAGVWPSQSSIGLRNTLEPPVATWPANAERTLPDWRAADPRSEHQPGS